MSNFQIWAVDDDPLQRLFIEDELADEWRLRLFDSGEAVLAALDRQEALPDLALCDVQMPGIDGFAVCRALREAAVSRRMQILFLSANADYAAKLAGYDAGCDDYLAKPMDGDTLRYKVQLAERAVQQQQAMSQEIDSARGMAFNAMISASELGGVIDFIRRSQECVDERQLATLLLQAIQDSYGLNGCARLRDGERLQDLDAGGQPCSPLVSSILDNMQRMDRIFSFHDRICLNDHNLTLLVHNMPSSDPDRCGRLRDHLAIIVDAAARRLAALRVERQLAQQNQALALTMKDMTQAIGQLEKQSALTKEEISERIGQFCVDIQKLTIGFGLTDQQEFSLGQAVTDFGDAIKQLDAQNLATGMQLQGALDRLRAMLA